MADKYIVKATNWRGDTLVSWHPKGMVEAGEEVARRYTYEEAKAIAREEKRLRPGCRVVTKAVSS